MANDSQKNEQSTLSFESRSTSLTLESEAWFQEQWSTGVAAVTKGSNEVLSDTLFLIGRQLAKYKRNHSNEDWINLLAAARAHPLYELMMIDPFVKEARESTHPILAEPRLLDYFYGGSRPRKKITLIEPLSNKIFGYNSVTRRARAIRQMRLSIAEEVIMTASTQNDARMLSVGSGYLRELEVIPWHSQLAVELYLAVDRSYEVTSRVKLAFQNDKIKAITAQMWELARYGIALDGFNQRDFHLIYSIGALDSLDDFTSEKLITRLVSVLAPGGRLVLYNSRPLTADLAFQEAFIGQRLFSRSRTEIDLLFRPIRTQREFSLRIDDVEAEEFTRILIERYKTC